MILQENRSLRELVAKLDHGRSWLEDRVGALESRMKTSTFATQITNGATEGEAEKKAT